MKSLLLAAIRFYWFAWPALRRRRCLFRETCSKHVYRITERRGLMAGLRALRTRTQQCRPGFALAECAGHTVVVFADGSHSSPDVLAVEVRHS